MDKVTNYNDKSSRGVVNGYECFFLDDYDKGTSMDEVCVCTHNIVVVHFFEVSSYLCFGTFNV